jgi:chromosome segregation ATPase
MIEFLLAAVGVMFAAVLLAGSYAAGLNEQLKRATLRTRVLEGSLEQCRHDRDDYSEAMALAQDRATDYRSQLDTAILLAERDETRIKELEVLLAEVENVILLDAAEVPNG